MYWLMREPVCPRPSSRLPVPVVQIVGFVGPARDHRPQRVGAGLHFQPVHRRNEFQQPYLRLLLLLALLALCLAFCAELFQLLPLFVSEDGLQFEVALLANSGGLL